MNKHHLTLLLITACSFAQQAFSAAHFFKRLGLGAYKARSVLTGAGLTAHYAYEKYLTDKNFELALSQIDNLCTIEKPEAQEDFRRFLATIIPSVEFERLTISNPLESFFMALGPVKPAASSKNRSKNLIRISPDIVHFRPIHWILRHEAAHLLLGHHDEQYKHKQEAPAKQTVAAGLLTAYRAKGISSATAAQIFKKNIRSLGLFATYVLYNKYQLNQLIKQGEYEADAFALKYTQSLKELESSITTLKAFSNEKLLNTVIKNELEPFGLSNEYIEKISDLLIKGDIFNAFFVTHPKTEERIAKIQEKIDLLKAQEAAAELEKTNS